MGRSPRNVPSQAPHTVVPLSEQDFFSSDEGEAEHPLQRMSSAVSKKGALGETFVVLRGLDADSTGREAHILFSGCPGYVHAEVGFEERSQQFLGVVRFDSLDTASRAVRARRGTSWALGEVPVSMGLQSFEEGSRTLSTLKRQAPGVVRHASSAMTEELDMGARRASALRRERSTTPRTSVTFQDDDAGFRWSSPAAAARQQSAGQPLPGTTSKRAREGRAATRAASLGARSRSESPTLPAHRSAALRQILTKVHAAADGRKIEDLEALVAEAKAAGAEEEELQDARRLLGQHQTIMARNVAIRVESRARAKLGEALAKGIIDEAVKSSAMIEFLVSGLKAARDASAMCAQAGLQSRECKLNAQANHISAMWRSHCVAKVHQLLERRDVAAIRAAMPECEAVGLEQTTTSRPILEAVRRICSGKCDWGEEERFQAARFAYSEAVMAKTAPALRRGLQMLEEAGVEAWEIGVARAAYREAEERVTLKWALIVAHIGVSRTENVLEMPYAFGALKETITLCQRAGMPKAVYEPHLAEVERLQQMERMSKNLHDAMQRGSITGLQSAIEQSKLFDHSTTKALVRQAEAALDDEQSRAAVKQRLEAAMAGRKTVILRALPAALTEAKDIGLRHSVIERADTHLAKAQAHKTLELAVASREPWSIRMAIDDARRLCVPNAAIVDAEEVLREASLRAELEFATRRGDAGALAKAIEAWDHEGYDMETSHSAKSALRSLQARGKELTSRLEAALATPITFDDYKADITSKGMAIIRDVANIISEYPDVAIQIDGHAASKTERMALKLSQERAEATSKALQMLGVQNVITAKGWGSAQRDSKRRMVKIYAR